MNPSYSVGIEYVTGSFTDVSSFVQRASFDRTIVDIFTGPQTDQFMFEVFNGGGSFSPKNNANLLPGKRVNFAAQNRVLFADISSFGGARVRTDARTLFFGSNYDLETIVVARVDSLSANTTLLGNFVATGNKRSWQLIITGALKPQITWSEDGVTTDGLAPPSAGPAALWANKFALRTLFKANVGGNAVNAVFDVSTDFDSLTMRGNWTTLGTGSRSAVSSIFNTSSGEFAAFGINSGVSGLGQGRLYFAQIANAQSGSPLVVFDPDTRANSGDTSFSSRLGNVWTLVSSVFLNTDTTSYALFSGILDSVQLAPLLKDQTAVITARSVISRLDRVFLTTPLFQNITAQSLFTEIMSRSAVNSFTCDALIDAIPNIWYTNRPATDALYELVQGGNYKLVVDGAGTFNLHNRYWGGLTTATASLDSFFDFNYTLDPSTILNDVKVIAQPRKLNTGIQTICYINSAIALPSSGYAGFWLTFQDPRQPSASIPVASYITPVSSTDWMVNAAADGTGTDYTSTASFTMTAYGATAVCTVFNGNANATYLTKFQIRGYTMDLLPTLSFTNQDSSSISTYGDRGLTLDNEIIENYNYMAQLCQALVLDRAQPRDLIRVVKKNQFPFILSAQVGDVLAVVNSVSGVNSQWSIQAIHHSIELQNGLEHTLAMDIQYFSSYPWLILDDAVRGKLDSGRVLAL